LIFWYNSLNMKAIKLEVEDSNLDVVLNIVNNLKDNIINKCEIITHSDEQKDFIQFSEKSLEKTWDNQEDSVYDKFLEI